MNAHVDIRGTTNMTSKGQVLIPKAVRDRVGLIPGEPVRVGINDRGEAVVLPAEKFSEQTREARRARIRAGIESVAGKYALGMSTEDFMADIRGPYPDNP